MKEVIKRVTARGLREKDIVTKILLDHNHGFVPVEEEWEVSSIDKSNNYYIEINRHYLKSNRTINLSIGKGYLIKFEVKRR